MARVGVENDKCKMTEEKSFQPVIVVHGGAWSVPDDISESTLTGVKEAAKTGYRLLCDGSSGVDAVVATVAELEDNPLYDAGRGSVLNVEGEIEMHALVMSGDTLKTGGVISTRSIKNPVKAAKLVMDETEHCVMSGNGAEAFARKHGIEEKPLDYFITPAAKQELDMFLEANITMDAFFNKLNRGHDTVGAVAIDKKGNLACATSTGGISGQIVGRVSDCPLPGCGGYADNNSGRWWARYAVHEKRFKNRNGIVTQRKKNKGRKTISESFHMLFGGDCSLCNSTLDKITPVPYLFGWNDSIMFE